MEELEILLKNKVGTAEFMSTMDLKSNISDISIAMRSIGEEE